MAPLRMPQGNGSHHGVSDPRPREAQGDNAKANVIRSGGVPRKHRKPGADHS